MRTCYAVLYIDKETRKAVRAHFASDFPVCGEFRYAQVVLFKREAATLDEAHRACKQSVRTVHSWAEPLFPRGEI